jgi:hypothetical protein
VLKKGGAPPAGRRPGKADDAEGAAPAPAGDTAPAPADLRQAS